MFIFTLQATQNRISTIYSFCSKKKKKKKRGANGTFGATIYFLLSCNVMYSLTRIAVLTVAIFCETVVFYLFETFKDSYQILKIVEKPDKLCAHKLGKRIIIPHTDTRK